MISFIDHRTIIIGLKIRLGDILPQTNPGKHSLYYKTKKVLVTFLLFSGITLKIKRVQDYSLESNLTYINRDIFKLIRFL